MNIAIIEDEAQELAQLAEQIQAIDKEDSVGLSFDIFRFQTIEDFETADLKTVT